MDKLPDDSTYPGNQNHWLSKELFLALHQELSFLVLGQIQREDIAADIASQCLVDLWVAIPQGADFFLIQSFLLHRMSKLVRNHKKEIIIQADIEHDYYKAQEADLLNGNASADTISHVLQYLPLLELSEQEVLQLFLEQQLDLEQIAQRLHIPKSRVERLYKHSIFRLRKATGQWNRYQ